MRFYRLIFMVALGLISLTLVVAVSAQEDTASDAATNLFLRRCLNAGFTEQECRRIYDALHDSDEQHFAERCLNAGYTGTQCRRIYNAFFGDDNGLMERCRAAGLTAAQCRRLVNANSDQDIAARCRAAELTPEQCRRIVSVDRVIDSPQRNPVRPVDGLRDAEQTDTRNDSPNRGRGSSNP